MWPKGFPVHTTGGVSATATGAATGSGEVSGGVSVGLAGVLASSETGMDMARALGSGRLS